MLPRKIGRSIADAGSDLLGRLLVFGQVGCAFVALGLGLSRVYFWPAVRSEVLPGFGTALGWIGGVALGLATAAAILVVGRVLFRRPVPGSCWVSLGIGALGILAVEAAMFAQAVMVR